MANARIQVPTEIKHGQIFEVRLLIRHPMETGLRHDEVGKAIPQNTITLLTCRYNSIEVFRAELFPGISANPYLSFFTTATQSGELEISWADDTGQSEVERIAITVLP
jgi:sulfur-oxidizing protein SoxZ